MDENAAFCLSLPDPGLSLDVAIFGLSKMGGGWEINGRSVPHHYLACWIAGEAACVIDGRPLRMGPGSAWWIAPGVHHSLRPAGTRRGFRFFHLRFACPTPIGHRALILPHASGLAALFQSLHETWRARDLLAPTAFRLQLAGLCAAMLRLPQDAGDGLPAALVSQISAWVSQRLPQPIHPRELAALAGLSLDWFTRRFTASFGLPPRVWLMHERVRWAANLLADGGLPVGQAAGAAGFANPALFSRQFRMVMGRSPRAWLARR